MLHDIYNQILFSCPQCHSDLILEGNEYLCSSCHRIYPVVDNIPVFSDIDNYYGEINKMSMSVLLEDSKNMGYAKALEKHINDSFVYKYTRDESRAKWLEIIPHGKTSRFLDAGCGWGTNAIPISKEVKEVVALDATYERVKFVEIRACQENIKNIIPVLGSAMKLPFPNESFDIVAFNGVIEWLGAANKAIDPIIIQKQALKEACRVLRPKGTIYIGIENRFSLRYILGDRDDHSFLKFTSLLPRRIANLYCLLRKGEKYYTHTHSLKTYHKMLTESGFVGTTTFYPWPNYRNPELIIPMNYEKISAFFIELLNKEMTMSINKRLYIQLLRLISYIERKGRFCHSFCFVAEK